MNPSGKWVQKALPHHKLCQFWGETWSKLSIATLLHFFHIKWPQNDQTSGQMTIYRKTEVIQSYFRIWERYTPIESGPPPRPPRSAAPVRFDSLKAKIGPLCPPPNSQFGSLRTKKKLKRGVASLQFLFFQKSNCNTLCLVSSCLVVFTS